MVSPMATAAALELMARLLGAAVTMGKSSDRMRVIDARCEPASTARTEFFRQHVERDRTRNAVVLSSFGPPPDAYVRRYVRVGCSCLLVVLRLVLSGLTCWWWALSIVPLWPVLSDGA
jgi:hypothetical protein